MSRVLCQLSYAALAVARECEPSPSAVARAQMASVTDTDECPIDV